MYIKKLLSPLAALTILCASSYADNIIKIPKTSFKSSPLKYAKSEAIIQLKNLALDNERLSANFKNLLDKTFGVKGYTIHIYSSLKAAHIKVKKYSTKEILKILKNISLKPFIESASANYIHSLSNKTNDTYYSKLWAIENTGQKVNNTSGKSDADMDIKEAWDIEEGNKNIIVAVLDTGVDYTHEDLKENMYNGNLKHGYDFAGDNDGNNDDDPMPDKPYDQNGHYHGTHVAGIIGAVGNNQKGISGTAQRVSIMALKVFRPNGYGYNSDILEAMDYISKKIDDGENIVAINASFGGSGGSQNDAMNKAIKKLGQKGVVFCAAAGNDGKNIDNDPIYPASYDAKNIIAVAASDQNDNLADFSNYGKRSVDVAAGGKNILSTYPQNKYAYMDGTSMATPYISGIVALLRAKYPSDSAEDIKNRILKNVDEIPSMQNKIASKGRANAYKALSDLHENPPKKNNPPVAKDDKASVERGDSVTIEALKNDYDPDGDKIKILNVSKPPCGEVSYTDDKIIFDSNGCQKGSYQFKYQIEDEKKAKGEANIKIEVKSKSSGWGFFGGDNNSGGWFF